MIQLPWDVHIPNVQDEKPFPCRFIMYYIDKLRHFFVEQFEEHIKFEWKCNSSLFEASRRTPGWRFTARLPYEMPCLWHMRITIVIRQYIHQTHFHCLFLRIFQFLQIFHFFFNFLNICFFYMFFFKFYHFQIFKVCSFSNFFKFFLFFF